MRLEQYMRPIPNGVFGIWLLGSLKRPILFIPKTAKKGNGSEASFVRANPTLISFHIHLLTSTFHKTISFFKLEVRKLPAFHTLTEAAKASRRDRSRPRSQHHQRVRAPHKDQNPPLDLSHYRCQYQLPRVNPTILLSFRFE